MNEKSARNPAPGWRAPKSTVRVIAADALGRRRGHVLENVSELAMPRSEALDDAIPNVVAKIHPDCICDQKGAVIDADEDDADQPARQARPSPKTGRPAAASDDAAPSAARRPSRQRIDRHDVHRLQLLGRLHQPDLGCHRQPARDARAAPPPPSPAARPDRRQGDEDAERLGRLP